eukprot:40204-Eustigmatos_ZCMA.PRE.1
MVMAVVLDRPHGLHETTSTLHPHTPADDRITPCVTALITEPTELREECGDPCVVRRGKGMGVWGL